MTALDQAQAEAGVSADPFLVTVAIIVFAVLGVTAAWAMWWPELRRHIRWWREQRRWNRLDADAQWRREWQEQNL